MAYGRYRGTRRYRSVRARRTFGRISRISRSVLRHVPWYRSTHQRIRQNVHRLRLLGWRV